MPRLKKSAARTAQRNTSKRDGGKAAKKSTVSTTKPAKAAKKSVASTTKLAKAAAKKSAASTAKRNDGRNNRRVEGRRLKERKLYFPDIPESSFYSEDKKKGWKQVPRTMPHILNLMDRMSKGSPLSKTYFDIWMSAWSESFIVVNSSNDRAFAAGFSGERCASTWKRKVDKLEEIGFIKTVESGNKLYIAIFDPHMVVKKLEKEQPSGFDRDVYKAMVLCAHDFGLTALEDEADGK